MARYLHRKTRLRIEISTLLIRRVGEFNLFARDMLIQTQNKNIRAYGSVMAKYPKVLAALGDPSWRENLRDKAKNTEGLVSEVQLEKIINSISETLQADSRAGQLQKELRYASQLKTSSERAAWINRFPSEFYLQVNNGIRKGVSEVKISEFGALEDLLAGNNLDLLKTPKIMLEFHEQVLVPSLDLLPLEEKMSVLIELTNLPLPVSTKDIFAVVLNSLDPVTQKYFQLFLEKTGSPMAKEVAEIAQSRLAPFDPDGQIAIATIEKAYGKKLSEIFSSFETKPNH